MTLLPQGEEAFEEKRFELVKFEPRGGIVEHTEVWQGSNVSANGRMVDSMA